MKTIDPEQFARRSEERAQMEKNLVGALIFHGVGRKPFLPLDALSICPPQCFISPAKIAAEAIADVAQRGFAVDLLTVTETMKRMTGGLPVQPAELATWAAEFGGMFTEQSTLRAAEIIAAEGRKDSALVEIGSALESLRTFSVPADMAVESLRRAQAALDGDAGGSRYDFDGHLDAFVAALDSGAQQPPVKSPWQSVTQILRGGILPGELVILAARPSVGKSALALNWAWSVACSGKGVVFVSLEMGSEQLIQRQAANVGDIDVGSFRAGLTPPEIVRARQAIAAMRGRPVELIEQGRVTVADVRRQVRSAQRRREVGLVVVDYLQLVTPDDAKAPREQQVASMSRGFKLMAKELGVPVLLLAQLSRKGEDASREPILSDLRESGAIEQDADIVIFLHQARKRNYSNPDEPVKFIVAKGRSSGVGSGHLIFRRRIQRFEESSDAIFRQAEQDEEREAYGRRYGELADLA